MNVKLYINSSDPKVSQKSLTLKATLNNVQLTEQTSVENPSFLLDYNVNYLSCNYVYCTEFNRYYFVTGREIRNGNQIIINCHVDWRKSFRSQILNSNIIADRSFSNVDAYVPDNMATVRDSIKTITRTIPNTVFVGPSGSNQYVLTIGGR